MKKIALSALCLLLSGCLLVDDFGTEWEKGETDTCIRLKDATPTQVHRSVTIQGYDFLMLKDDASNKGGMLLSYEINDEGEIVAYDFRQDKVADFEKAHPNSPIILEKSEMLTTARVTSLTPEVYKIIGDVAGNEDYWEQAKDSPFESYKNCKK